MRRLGVLLLVALVPASASAQARFRRPFASESAPITAHFDTNGPGGGLADYVCGGRTYDGHTGTDFGIPMGTPVLAAAAGQVISVMTGCPDVGYNCSPCGGLCGNQVRLRHADGSETLYCHMQSGGMRVRVGDAVSCGQTIGHSASSGCSTGPHLHFGYHPRAGAPADDPFRGACGGPVSVWTEQRAYPQTPGATCDCAPSAETCDGRDQDCDGRVDEGVTRACSSACGSGTEACSGGGWGACDAPQPSADVCNGRDDDCDGTADEDDVCEIELLNEQPSAYAPPRSTDVDADGRADLCARGGAGVRCWPASASGWSAEWAPIPWSDVNGWSDPTNYATLRMGDVNGDGRADVCARSDGDVLCARSNGSGFDGHTTWLAGLSDENASGLPQYYTTLRLADVNGDGRDDLCARDRAGFGCWLSDGARFDRRIEGPRWSDESGWGAARHYGTIRMGDLDGDRRADVCARAAAGVECWLSSGDGFDTRVEGPRWSDESGWGAMRYWSTLRLVDFDGDGLGDLCARSSTDLRCVRGTGSGFGEPVIVHPMSDESGWDDIANYATLRVGDIDGDGADDLCARANAGVTCFAWDGSAFVQRAGPEWSDESGWSQARHYQTMRLADFDGDGLDDVCARAGAGWRCHPSTGEGFGAAVTLDELTDAGGWVEPRYWSTILSAGHACRAEMESCNGRDDDCDGEVDEHATDEICNDADDDCDGAIDESLRCDVPVIDGGTIPRGDAGTSGGGTVRGGCACGVSRGSPPLVLVLVLGVVLALRRRRT
ncbi:VCBS repeat domain-containing M23 family metallopeptidase [Sandaracinus amylolyticus]|nr:VCBS repeat domain-containing M23 family metallopeptidase [Sandaracinus amylolyticus]